MRFGAGFSGQLAQVSRELRRFLRSRSTGSRWSVAVRRRRILRSTAGCRLASILGLVVPLVNVACARSDNEESESGAFESLVALQLAPPEGSSGWAVQRPTARVSFTRGEVKLDTQLTGQTVPLKDGGILVSYVTHPHEFEGLVCYLELQCKEQEWRPRAVGLYFGCCLGAWWLDDLRGQVTIATKDDGGLAVAVDLESSDSRGKWFRRSFPVDPRGDSTELREALAWFKNPPRLAPRSDVLR